MTNTIKWWGYCHNNGTQHVRRFLGEGYGVADMNDARQSPFIRDVFGPFESQNQHTATLKLKKIAARDKEAR